MFKECEIVGIISVTFYSMESYSNHYDLVYATTFEELDEKGIVSFKQLGERLLPELKEKYDHYHFYDHCEMDLTILDTSGNKVDVIRVES